MYPLGIGFKSIDQRGYIEKEKYNSSRIYCK
jgi:hypothetical protein